MKKTIVLSLLFLCLQIPTMLYANEDGQTSGTFTISQNGATIEASYTLAPAAPDNIVLHIRPTAAFVLNAHIIDMNGNELIKLETQTVNSRYANSIDVSKLTPGTYYIEVLGETAEQNYRISFTKS